ncbi:MAG: helix-turn-helix transcriptional regulator [Alphaproteobacteria bacterium]|nr:helix-turn-helix transcriptional regulator [Alphaproteobacteria bacterium]
MDIRKRLGVRLRELRTSADLTQEQLAERVGGGCAAMTISRYERGVLDPSLARLEQICQALGTDLDDLLSRVVDQRAPLPSAAVQDLVDHLSRLDPVKLRGARKVLKAYIEVVEGSKSGS